MVGVNHGSFDVGVVAQHAAKTPAVENVVAKDERHLVVADEFLTENKGLGESIGDFLLHVGEGAAPLAAVAKQALEPGRSWGVEMIRMSRIPLIISVDKG